jgi:hypothetical protein
LAAQHSSTDHPHLTGHPNANAQSDHLPAAGQSRACVIHPQHRRSGGDTKATGHRPTLARKPWTRRSVSGPGSTARPRHAAGIRPAWAVASRVCTRKPDLVADAHRPPNAVAAPAVPVIISAERPANVAPNVFAHLSHARAYTNTSPVTPASTNAAARRRLRSRCVLAATSGHQEEVLGDRSRRNGVHDNVERAREGSQTAAWSTVSGVCFVARRATGPDDRFGGMPSRSSRRQRGPLQARSCLDAVGRD